MADSGNPILAPTIVCQERVGAKPLFKIKLSDVNKYIQLEKEMLEMDNSFHYTLGVIQPPSYIKTE